MIVFVCLFVCLCVRVFLACIRASRADYECLSNSQMIKWTVHPSKNNHKNREETDAITRTENFSNIHVHCTTIRWCVVLFLVHFFSRLPISFWNAWNSNKMCKINGNICPPFNPFAPKSFSIPSILRSIRSRGSNKNRKCPTFCCRHWQLRMVFTVFFHIRQWIGRSFVRSSRSDWVDRSMVGWLVVFDMLDFIFVFLFASQTAIIYV